MKYYILPALVALLLLNPRSASAQQNAIAANGNTITDKSVVAGNFEINKPNTARSITEHINVNYVLSPAPFANVLNLQLNTADPLLFSADVADSKGKPVLQWQPSEKNHAYNGTIDISKLSPGNYLLNIYCEYGPSLIQSISFTKENSKN